MQQWRTISTLQLQTLSGYLVHFSWPERSLSGNSGLARVSSAFGAQRRRHGNLREFLHCFPIGLNVASRTSQTRLRQDFAQR